jgi:hypothetical protein
LKDFPQYGEGMRPADPDDADPSRTGWCGNGGDGSVCCLRRHMVIKSFSHNR